MADIIEYFFDAYFHQDWRDDYGSSFEAVEDFAKAEPAELKAQLVSALTDLLKQGELPQDTINKLGGNFRPESEGMEVSDWINRVLETLKK